MNANPGQEGFSRKHLLGIEPLSAPEITTILDTAVQMREIMDRPIKKVPTLRGRTVVNLFMEASTRTRASFEMAERILSADSLTVQAAGSSVSKGESLLDTVKNLEAMTPDAIVVRHASAGAANFLARSCNSRIINAGDGAHEHPTQALLDAFTLRHAKGRIEGLKVAIVGDVLHSRVARSNVHLLTKMGAEVTLCAPPSLLPQAFSNLATLSWRMDEALEGADVVMMLRLQQERMTSAFISTAREYHAQYGLTLARLRKAKSDVVVLHPGPMNRGVEIASDVADSKASLILDQVTNGVAVRMAVLYLLLGGGRE
jgi:aspartate carbamoyltransferase catalytic subunit